MNRSLSHKGQNHNHKISISIILLGLSIAIGGLTVKAQSVAVKSNMAYLATTTPNIGMEYKLHDQWSLSISSSYNPFLFAPWQDEAGQSYNPKLIHWTIVPEIKYWFCQCYERSFLGLHGIYGSFNIGAIPFIDALKHVRYHGRAYGAGISYGYHWAIGGRWGLELSAGIGYLRLEYDKCDAFVCGNNIGAYMRDYIGPTKLAITLSYFIH